MAKPPAAGQAVRLGGMVENGSLKTDADGVTIRFVVGDGKAGCRCASPASCRIFSPKDRAWLQKARMEPDGTFVADNLLAKHDENYVPRELQDMTEAQKRAAVAGTK